MNLQLLFSDSMGVRSMATVVELENDSLFIDASAALGPSRYGLPPHQLELEALSHAKKTIGEIAGDCRYFVITHYHYDHYDPDESFYAGKTVFAKRIDRHINKSQKERGSHFHELFEKRTEIVYCDDTTHEVDGHTITFSPPFPHGPPGTRLGYVIMVSIEGKEKLLFASDVQGPVDEKTRDYIINEQPDILIMDGPPSYFLGWKFSHEHLRMAENNLLEIMEKTHCRLILDHHLLRDMKYRERMKQLYECYDDRIQTFAEQRGMENTMLEARRKELWGRT
ncbi:MAG TPA: MBL fold metallo-hydrolase [Thermoplasmatales archaeon]|nr:MAG: MBL fold metallo-hydrolase [Thermoplasmata archaeon]HDN51308.1 MBL fold metallo-hydrolase [Thermoplasmatales archaeon]